jgi:phosphatidylglycerophosphate synthase
MKPQIFIPAAISSLRIAALPLFVIFYSKGNMAACLGLLFFCAATDYLDGYLARRLSVASKLGAYYDATTDFTFMFGLYAFFVFLGLYPVWLTVLIVAAFAQFIATSLFAKKLYDPVGKYIGSALYIGVALTLLAPDEVTFLFVQYAFLGFFIVSLLSRIVSLIRKPAKTSSPGAFAAMKQSCS